MWAQRVMVSQDGSAFIGSRYSAGMRMGSVMKYSSASLRFPSATSALTRST